MKNIILRNSKMDKEHILALIQKGDVEALKQILTPDNIHTELYQGGKDVPYCIIETGNLELLSILDAFPNMYVRPDFDWTPLHQAISNHRCHLLFIEYLLEKPEIKKQINQVDEFGLPPLYYAIVKSQHDKIDLLLAHNAKFNIEDCRGYSAIHYAVEMGNVELVEKLLRLGADRDAMTKQKETPLQLLEKREKDAKYYRIRTLLSN